MYKEDLDSTENSVDLSNLWKKSPWNCCKCSFCPVNLLVTDIVLRLTRAWRNYVPYR